MHGLQKFYLTCLTAWLGLTTTLLAQSDSTAKMPNLSPPERLAVLGFSEAAPLRRPSQNLAQTLAEVCSRDSRFIVTAENTLAVYLKKRRDFSIFLADSVQALCKNLALQYLLVVSLEPQTATPGLWPVTLRWFEGSSGQITKIHAGEYQSDPNSAESFPLHEMFTALLDMPDIIVSAEPSLAETPQTAPMPEISEWPNDSTAFNAPPEQVATKRGRSWFWYVTGVALVSGGSAAILLKNPNKAGAPGKTLLPEPPDPPK